MKVVYIGSGDWATVYGPDNHTNDPIKDNIYTVVDTSIYKGITYYRLKECGLCRYDAEFFVPLDDYLNQFTANLVEELENCQLIEV